LIKIKSKSECVFNEFFIRKNKQYNKLCLNVDTADGGGGMAHCPPPHGYATVSDEQLTETNDYIVITVPNFQNVQDKVISNEIQIENDIKFYV